jgi:hypothetical protein
MIAHQRSQLRRKKFYSYPSCYVPFFSSVTIDTAEGSTSLIGYNLNIPFISCATFYLMHMSLYDGELLPIFDYIIITISLCSQSA